jgi:hypothetical protein
MWIEVTRINGEKVMINTPLVTSFKAEGNGAVIFFTDIAMYLATRETYEMLKAMLPQTGKNAK